MSHEEIETALVSILSKNGVRKIGLFGSYARGEERTDSDLDVLGGHRDIGSGFQDVKLIGEDIGAGLQT
jgi:predicted nucleotidyltransferase